MKNIHAKFAKKYADFAINTVKAYKEVIVFIAAGTTPREGIEFRPSEAAQAWGEDLLNREKDGALPSAEKSELDHYLQIEYLMRLAKARDFLPNN